MIQKNQMRVSGSTIARVFEGIALSPIKASIDMQLYYIITNNILNNRLTRRRGRFLRTISDIVHVLPDVDWRMTNGSINSI